MDSAMALAHYQVKFGYFEKFSKFEKIFQLKFDASNFRK